MYMSINDITFRYGRQLSGRDSNLSRHDLENRSRVCRGVFMRLALLQKKKDNGMLIRSEYRACVKWEYKS